FVIQCMINGLSSRCCDGQSLLIAFPLAYSDGDRQSNRYEAQKRSVEKEGRISRCERGRAHAGLCHRICKAFGRKTAEEAGQWRQPSAIGSRGRCLHDLSRLGGEKASRQRKER